MAQSELEKLQRRYEEKPSQWFAALAEEYRRAGDLERALQIVRAGLEERSNYVSGHIVLARCLLDQGEDAEAQQVLERVLELDAENVIALKVLSEIAERVGDPAAARDWLKRLLEVDPMNEEGQQMLERLADVEAAPARRPSWADLAKAEEPSPGDAPAPDVVEPPEAPAGATPEAAPDLVPLEGFSDQRVPPAEPPHEAVGAGWDAGEVATAPSGGDAAVAPEDLVVDHVGEPGAGPPPAETGEPPTAPPVETVDLALEPTGFESLPSGAGPGTEEREAPVVDGFEPTEQVPAMDRGVLPEGDVTWFEGGNETTDTEITGADIEHDQPLELSSEAGQGPPPEGLVRAQVERPEPIHLDGGPGMPVGQDQSQELAGEVGEEVPAERLPEPPYEEEPSPLGTEPPLAAESQPLAAEVPLTPEPVAEGPPPSPPGPDAVVLPEPEPVEGEPGPVVTETMAEVYLRQGLRDEALAVYRQLLASRPDDRAIQDRIATLEAETAAPAVAPRAARPSYLAADTGGRSTRAFLGDVLAAGIGGQGNHPSPQPELEEPTPMEAAFGETEQAGMPGTPTRPAPDGASLASVFGDEPPPQPSPPTPPSEEGAPEPPRDGVSFDEFFGGTAPPADTSESGASAGDTDETPPEDEDFKDWLKGLKS